MKLKLMDMEKFAKGLTPVTSVESKTKDGQWNPEGLFSEKIFGIEGSIERSKLLSYLDLSTYIIHPAIFTILKRLDQKIVSLFSTAEYFSINSKGELVQDDDGFTGIPEFIKNFGKIKFKGGTTARDQLIKVVDDSYKNKTIFINKIPVIPPEFRPEYEDERGKTITDDINEIYVSIIKKASQVKSIGSGPVYDNLVYGMQIAVNGHDKFLQTKISKKHGIIRNNILGKRVDFSGRAVIVPGPDLDVNQLGVPLRLAVPLFEPFLIHYLLYTKSNPRREEFQQEAEKYLEAPLNVETIKRLFRSLKKGAVLPETLKEIIFEATEIVMKGRVIVSKRDPVLQSQSCKPLRKLSYGKLGIGRFNHLHR